MKIDVILDAGMAILADRPYKLGDYIIIDTGERGQVTHIGLRSTRLLTRDDIEVSIPNGVMEVLTGVAHDNAMVAENPEPRALPGVWRIEPGL